MFIKSAQIWSPEVLVKFYVKYAHFVLNLAYNYVSYSLAPNRKNLIYSWIHLAYKFFMFLWK